MSQHNNFNDRNRQYENKYDQRDRYNNRRQNSYGYNGRQNYNNNRKNYGIQNKKRDHYESKLEMWFFAVMSAFFSVLCSLLWFGILFENGVCIAIGVVVTIVVAATIIVVALVQKDKFEHNYQNKNYYKKNRNNRYY